MCSLMMHGQAVRTTSQSNGQNVAGDICRVSCYFSFRFMKKREQPLRDTEDSMKPDTSMVDIVARVTENEIFSEFYAGSRV